RRRAARLTRLPYTTLFRSRKRALGRGLDALIGAGARRRENLELPDVGTGPGEGNEPIDAAPAIVEERLERLPLSQLSRGKYQPRDRKSTRLNSSHVKISYA